MIFRGVSTGTNQLRYTLIDDKKDGTTSGNK